MVKDGGPGGIHPGPFDADAATKVLVRVVCAHPCIPKSSIFAPGAVVCAASSCFPGAAVTPLPVLVLALPQQGFLLISTSHCPALAQTSSATTPSRC